MKYTKFFALNGQPNLSDDQFKRYMNIVHLEGRIEGLRLAQKMTPEQPNKFNLDVFNAQRVLTDLTGNVSPSELIKQMYNYK